LDVGDLSEKESREIISKDEADCIQAETAPVQTADVEIKDEPPKLIGEQSTVEESEGCKDSEVGSNSIKSNMNGKDSAEIPSKKPAGRQKAVAKVKMTSEATGEVSKDAELQASKPSNSTANARTATKAKESLSLEEREKRERLLRNELIMLSEMRVYCEFMPMLRPSVEDLQDLEEMKEADGPLPIKLRQLISRFIEGRQQSSEGMVECLKVFLQSVSCDSEKSIDFSRIENVMPTLGEYVACRPQLQSMETCDQMVEFTQRWEVKDMADIPERFRLIVDVHRKMEAAVKERMLHLFEMIKELNTGGKGLAKLERALVAMKDRYAKLEERERKEKEKLETKLDADRKKLEEARKKQEENRKKQEENRKKQEENKKKQEEKDEKSKKKEDEVRVKEKKVKLSSCLLYPIPMADGSTVIRSKESKRRQQFRSKHPSWPISSRSRPLPPATHHPLRGVSRKMRLLVLRTVRPMPRPCPHDQNEIRRLLSSSIATFTRGRNQRMQ
jgi:hypothetical protein